MAINRASFFALEAHGDQKYGDEPYGVHLQEVAGIVAEYTNDETVIDAAWLHDVIEDTNTTFDDLRREFNLETALIVWACSGEGANRKEKQQSIIDKLRQYKKGWLVKASDRLANLRRTIKEDRKDKFEMYVKEHDKFMEGAYGNIPFDLYNKLNWIVIEQSVKLSGLV